MNLSRLLLIPLALLALLATPLPGSGETEPNNNKTEADSLKSGVPMPGQMLSQSDQDWFSLVTSGPEDIPITFLHDYVSSSFSQYYVLAYDDQGNLLSSNGIHGNDEETKLTLGVASAGKYYIVVKPCAVADYFCTTYYSDPYTLTASFTSPSSVVDLSVKTISGPSIGTVGQTISILNTVRNQGTDDASGFAIGLFLSKDKVIDPIKDRLVGGRSLINGLRAGFSSSKTSLVAIPSDVAPGLYYFGAVVDLTKAVAETNEVNNTKASLNQIEIVK